MDDLRDIKEFVQPPRALEDEVKYSSFVTQVKAELDKIPVAKKKELLVDLIIYVSSLVELLLPETNQGKQKKKLVLDVLNGIETPDNLERLLELTLKSGNVVQKTFYKRAKLWFKKRFFGEQQKK